MVALTDAACRPTNNRKARRRERHRSKRTSRTVAQLHLAERHTNNPTLSLTPCFTPSTTYDVSIIRDVRLTELSGLMTVWVAASIHRCVPMHRSPAPIHFGQRIRRASTPRQSEDIAADMIVSLRQRAARHNLDLSQVMRDALIGLAAELPDSPEELGNLVSTVAEEARAGLT